MVSVDAQGELKELAEEFNNMQKAVVSREQVIAHQAYHDELTDLPNRHRSIQLMEAQILNGDAEDPQKFCVVKLSILHVGEINSSLGHTIGDAVIEKVSVRLRLLADKDNLFHLGGDF